MKIDKANHKGMVVNSEKKSASILRNTSSDSKKNNPGTNLKIQLVNLLKSIDESIKTLKIQDLRLMQQALAPLSEIIQLLGKSSLDPLDGDVQLMEKFLHSWLDKYGNKLPKKQKRELLELRNLLTSRKLHTIADDGNKTILTYMSSLENDSLKWKVTYEKENESLHREENKEITCVLNLSTKYMGEIRVVLVKADDKSNCNFQSADISFRKAIKKSLPDFINQLVERGLEIPEFKVGNLKKDNPIKTNWNTKELDIWG